MRKFLIFFPFFMLSFGFVFAQQSEKIIIIKGKEILVSGNSTLGKFNCNSLINKKDTIFFKSQNEYKFSLNINNFNCKNIFITKDFQRTLKSDLYPVIEVNINDIRNINNNIYICNLVLIITGKKIYYKDVILTKKDDIIKSSIKLNFSDLGLKTLSKLGGILKVKDEINISFKLIL